MNAIVPLDITIYTDPLCCWSWGAMSEWEDLKNCLGIKARWFLRMGGLLSTWSSFKDEMHSVNRPGQMGPMWMHAGQLMNVRINTQVWRTDPPSSSYPACLAVKAAQVQSLEFGWELFYLVQNACMQDGKNIADQQVLESVAVEMARKNEQFSVNKFLADLTAQKTREAFHDDLQQMKSDGVTRFPTIVIRSGVNGLRIAGFYSSANLLESIERKFPVLTATIL